MKPIDSLFNLVKVPTTKSKSPYDYSKGITSKLLKKYKSSEVRIAIGGSKEETRRKKAA